jgi:hypothetical protein
MTAVQVERPEDTKLAVWFAELRLWFDNNDCTRYDSPKWPGVVI